MAILNDQPVKLISDSLGNLHPLIATTMTETTYADLVALRDAGALIPGMSYRITDYTYIPSDERYQSGNHSFDIVVQALADDELSEDATATWHAGDAYFANNYLPGWKLKYTAYQYPQDLCSDQDTASYKGFIYYMQDEFNNTADYDFKNVMFRRSKVTQAKYNAAAVLVGEYVYDTSCDSTMLVCSDLTDCKYYYTFSHEASGAISDASLTGRAANNTVKGHTTITGHSTVLVAYNTGYLLGNTCTSDYITPNLGTFKATHIIGSSFTGSGNIIINASSYIVDIAVTGSNIIVYNTAGSVRRCTWRGNLSAFYGRQFTSSTFENVDIVDFKITGTPYGFNMYHVYSVNVNSNQDKYWQYGTMRNLYKTNVTCNGISSEVCAFNNSVLENLYLCSITIPAISTSSISNIMGNPSSEYMTITGSTQMRESSISNWHRGSLTFGKLERDSFENLHRSYVTLGNTEECMVRNIHDKTYSNTTAMTNVIIQPNGTNVVNI